MGLVIEQRVDTLDQVAAAIVQFETMPAWIRDETGQQRFSCLQQAFAHGFDQMDALRDGSQIYLEIRVGGVDGSVFRVGRSYIANMFDYAQMLNAKRNDITDKVKQQEGQRGIMVHSGIYKNGFPEYEKVPPDRFDAACIQAQMEGARSAYDSRVDDHRVKVFLDRALDGDTFRETPLKDSLQHTVFIFNGGDNGT